MTIEQIQKQLEEVYNGTMTIQLETLYTFYFAWQTPRFLTLIKIDKQSGGIETQDTQDSSIWHEDCWRVKL